jgi:hypothetical protein
MRFIIHFITAIGILACQANSTFADELDSIRTALKSEQFNEVDLAIHRLTKSQSMSLVPELCDLAQYAPQPVSWSALRRLSYLKPTNTDDVNRLVQTLVSQLSHEQHAYRFIAIEGLIRQGDNAVTAIESVLDSDTGVARSGAVTVLINLNKLDQPKLIQLSRDPDARVRFIALMALDTTLPDARKELIRLLKDDEQSIVEVATELLSSLPIEVSNASVEALLKGLEREDTKTAATLALARMGVDVNHTLDEIIGANATGTTGGRFGHWAVEAAMLHIGDPSEDSMEALIELIKSSNLTICSNAALCVGTFGTRAASAAPILESRIVELLKWVKDRNAKAEDDGFDGYDDELVERSKCLSTLFETLWYVTGDDSLYKEHWPTTPNLYCYEIERSVAKSTNYTSGLFLELVNQEPTPLIERKLYNLVSMLTHDDELIAFLESKVVENDFAYRRIAIEAYVRTLNHPTENTERILVDLANENLRDALQVVKIATQHKLKGEGIESIVEEAINRIRDHHDDELIDAWLSYQNDAASAFEILLANEKVSARVKIAAINRHKVYDAKSIDFLERELSNEDEWAVHDSVYAMGQAAGLVDPKLERRITSILKKQHARLKKVGPDEQQPFGDYDRILVTKIALHRATGNKDLIRDLIKLCYQNQGSLLFNLSDVFEPTDIDFTPYQEVATAALEQSVSELNEGLNDHEFWLDLWCHKVIQIDHEAGYRQVQELTNHRDALVRSIAGRVLSKLQQPKVE